MDAACLQKIRFLDTIPVMGIRRFYIISIFILCLSPVWGADHFLPPDFDLKGSVDFWYAYLDLGWKGLHLFPGVNTILWAGFGTGNIDENFFRDSHDAYWAGENPATDPAFNAWTFHWRAGLAQGLFRKTVTGENVVEGFFFYQGRTDKNFQTGSNQLIFQSKLPDAGGFLLHAFLTGFSLNTLKQFEHMYKRGVYGEVSTEYGPGFMNKTADYLRFNIKSKGFLPLFDLNNDGSAMNLLSMYAGYQAACDYSISLDEARPVPIVVLQTIGGRYTQEALGGAVRGYDYYAFDGAFKAMVNLELRLNLPAFLIPPIVPGIAVFLDGGYTYDPERFGNASPGKFLLSTGTGFYLNCFDLAGLGIYMNYALTEPKPDGTRCSFPVLHLNFQF